MAYLGELISLGVALLWTISALAAEVATKRAGVLVLNVWRMALAFVVSSVLLWIVTGHALPLNAGCEAWVWLLLSGFVGYFLGDWCLFNSYLVIGSRFGQLFMTLAPAFTAFFAWVMIGQTLSWNALTAMLITLSGDAHYYTRRLRSTPVLSLWNSDKDYPRLHYMFFSFLNSVRQCYSVSKICVEHLFLIQHCLGIVLIGATLCSEDIADLPDDILFVSRLHV